MEWVKIVDLLKKIWDNPAFHRVWKWAAEKSAERERKRNEERNDKVVNAARNGRGA